MATKNVLIDRKNSRLYKIINDYNFYISTITLYKLFAGAINEQKRKDINDFITLTEVLPFTIESAIRAGEIYLSLRAKNEIIEVSDILIGAAAITHNLLLITLNEKHFERINELNILKI